MKVTKVKETPVNENPHKVDVRKLYDRDSAQAVHIMLNPGESLKPHMTPVDIFFFVIEGTPEILVGDAKQSVEPNDLIESPKGIVHCIYNNSMDIVRVLVVKAPRPMENSKVL
ncbi:MAG: cupin domain-containing protein [Saprospiraceae bacterium]|nr:cupin domain-containing protein [Saprospiraceae bacterium]